MKHCKCEHWQVCPTCRPGMFDEDGQMLPVIPAPWINPNNKTQARYLPNIGEKVIFAHGDKTYYGHHTGGSFKTGAGVTAKHFDTWVCVWMPIPQAPNAKLTGGGAND